MAKPRRASTQWVVMSLRPQSCLTATSNRHRYASIFNTARCMNARICRIWHGLLATGGRPVAGSGGGPDPSVVAGDGELEFLAGGGGEAGLAVQTLGPLAGGRRGERHGGVGVGEVDGDDRNIRGKAAAEDHHAAVLVSGIGVVPVVPLAKVGSLLAKAQ